MVAIERISYVSADARRRSSRSEPLSKERAKDEVVATLNIFLNFMQILSI